MSFLKKIVKTLVGDKSTPSTDTVEPEARESTRAPGGENKQAEGEGRSPRSGGGRGRGRRGRGGRQNRDRDDNSSKSDGATQGLGESRSRVEGRQGQGRGGRNGNQGQSSRSGQQRNDSRRGQTRQGEGRREQQRRPGTRPGATTNRQPSATPGAKEAAKTEPKAPSLPRPAPTPVEPTGFLDLGLRDEITRAVGEQGYSNPTPIQQAAIKPLLQGRDLLGCAQTGTGKTAAFALPTLHRLSQKTGGRAKPIRALVLTPTRELALQVAESYQAYGKHLDLTTVVIFGGVGAEPQKVALQRGMDVLVATPGRLLDLFQQRYVRFDDLEILVLDEADRMLDMGFLPDVKRILKELPPERQNILFSATMPRDIQELSMRLLKDPVRVEVAPVSSTSEQVEQEIYFVARNDKRHLLLHLLEDESTKRVLVFTRTKAIANRIAKFLVERHVTAEAIHGNKSQSARQRALDNFKSGLTRVLVASDLAARGLDVDDISHVVNYDLPNVAETYVHRIGRTGRASARGKAVSFVDQEERPYLRDIERTIGKKVPVVDEHPFSTR